MVWGFVEFSFISIESFTVLRRIILFSKQVLLYSWRFGNKFQSIIKKRSSAHLLAHNTFKFINLTHRLAWVSLPSRHFRIAHFAEFLNAEFCSFRHTSSCPIVVNRGLHGVHKAAYIKKRGCCEISVEITGEILKSQTDITELQVLAAFEERASNFN